jgi:hypothetical protein
LQSVGRIIFVSLMWLFSLGYYLECRGLSNADEKMTISAAFWILTLFVAAEFFRLIRIVFREKDLQNLLSVEMLKRILSDRKTHLVALIILYLILIPVVGFYVISFLAFCAFSYTLGTRGFVKVIVPGIIVLGVIYMIFTRILGLALSGALLF